MRRAMGEGGEAGGAGGVEALGEVEDPSEGGVEAPGRDSDRGGDIELDVDGAGRRESFRVESPGGHPRRETRRRAGPWSLPWRRLLRMTSSEVVRSRGCGGGRWRLASFCRNMVVLRWCWPVPWGACGGGGGPDPGSGVMPPVPGAGSRASEGALRHLRPVQPAVLVQGREAPRTCRRTSTLARRTALTRWLVTGRGGAARWREDGSCALFTSASAPPLPERERTFPT
mgnify:FL=1